MTGERLSKLGSGEAGEAPVVVELESEKTPRGEGEAPSGEEEEGPDLKLFRGGQSWAFCGSHLQAWQHDGSAVV